MSHWCHFRWFYQLISIIWCFFLELSFRGTFLFMFSSSFINHWFIYRTSSSTPIKIMFHMLSLKRKTKIYWYTKNLFISVLLLQLLSAVEASIYFRYNLWGWWQSLISITSIISFGNSRRPSCWLSSFLPIHHASENTIYKYQILMHLAWQTADAGISSCQACYISSLDIETLEVVK